MKENENNQIKGVQMPPAWCGGICRNAMNDICVEDCSGFEPKPNLKLEDMPRFPETRYMTKEEKFTSVTVYLSKVVDHIQGREAENTIYPASRRSDFETIESERVNRDAKIENYYLISWAQMPESWVRSKNDKYEFFITSVRSDCQKPARTGKGLQATS